MADAHMWIRCCGCGKNNRGLARFISFGGGDWGLWDDLIRNFITEHLTEKCHGEHVYKYDEIPEYRFFELVTMDQARREGWWPARGAGCDS